MDDDFDALIAELEGEEQRPSPANSAVASSSFQAPSQPADELDDLLSELGGSTTSGVAKHSHGSRAVPTSAPAPVEDDLEALMSQLDGTAASPAPVSAPLQRNPLQVSSTVAVSGGDDLDDLLGQLGGSPAPSLAPSSARVASATPNSAGDELDDLLGQLESPGAVSSPAVASSLAQSAPRSGGGAPPPSDDLDALMSQLDIDSRASNPSSSYSPSPLRGTSSAAQGREEDDLDALLGQLGGTPVSVSPAASRTPSAYGGGGASSASSNGSSASVSASLETDDLDALISGLGGPLTPHASPAPLGGAYGQQNFGGASPSMNRSMASPSMGRGMGSPSMNSPSMGGRGMGSPSMGGRGMSSPSMGGRGVGSPSMGGRGVGSPSMGGRGMGSPSMGGRGMGRGMGSPSMGGRGLGSPSMGRGGGADLDNLLGSLNEQMSNINDGMTASKGLCAFCNKPIHGDVMQALGKTYHPEHFVCNSCQEPLGTKSFYESDGQPTCDTCYKNMFCPRCAFCNEAIPDRCITAMERKWHVKCFVCNNCLQPFPGGEFFEKAGMPYCKGCFSTNIASPCGGCGQPAAGGAVVNALNRQWHVQCFACDYCKRPFNGQPFFAKEGKAYCQQHYHQEAGGSCNGCKQPITGRCVDALGHRFHPNCFVCAYCMNPLSGGGFTERHGSPYCHECHGNLF